MKALVNMLLHKQLDRDMCTKATPSSLSSFLLFLELSLVNINNVICMWF